VPPDHLLPERLEAALAVVYLIFNEGWGGGRVDLAKEAIRLSRALSEFDAGRVGVLGLLALMLLNDSRRAARFRDGEIVLLDDQDRSLWNRAADRRRSRTAAAGTRPAGRRPVRHSGSDR